jgi:peptidoglycan/LPS O-acetylase OafA/YrhL
VAGCGSRHRKQIKYLLCFLLFGIAAGLPLNKMGAQADPAHPLANKGLMFFGFVISLGVIQPATIALAIVYLATDNGSSNPSNKTERVLSWLAAQTYDVYLLHPLVLFAIFWFVPPSTWFFKGSAASPISFFGLGAVTLLLSILAGYLQRGVGSTIALVASHGAQVISRKQRICC